MILKFDLSEASENSRIYSEVRVLGEVNPKQFEAIIRRGEHQVVVRGQTCKLRVSRIGMRDVREWRKYPYRSYDCRALTESILKGTE